MTDNSDYQDPPTCESCGVTAHFRTTDGGTWCRECHGAALRLGYDEDTGTPIRLVEVTS